MGPFRATVAEERAAVEAVSKCPADQLQKNEELLQDFADDKGLLEGSQLLMRQPLSDRLKAGLALWFNTVADSGCYRDQLAYNYAMWREDVNYALLSREMSPWYRDGL